MNPDFLVSFPGLGIENLPINRRAFSIFGMPVYWYGLLIAIALILCMLLAMRHASAHQLKSDDVLDIFIAVIPLMIVFARLYYVVLEWDSFKDNILSIVDTRRGGLAFYGGVIGGALGILLVTRLKKKPISRLLDFLAVYVPLGQAIGRWGNFFNQEAFGNNTTLPWGMISNQTTAYLQSVRIAGVDPFKPVHPTFFYEFIANLIIFVILLRLRKTAKTPFTVTLWYLLLYGFVRFFVEGIRTDPLMIGTTGIRASQLLSALMVIGAIVLLPILRHRRLKREFAVALSAEMAFRPDQSNEGGPVSDFIEISDSDLREESPEPAPAISTDDQVSADFPEEQTEGLDD
ncbi:MAG: prolipoprotein diacylglyceryl transferase [Saccharofermentanales bacterium]|nr:prolipoprotein diacylglyceryl transferase [Clostridiaceae bacterium]